MHSSVEDIGATVTQITQFSSGEKKTWQGVKTSSITQSEFTRFDTVDGRRVYVNTKNVNWFEIIQEPHV